jgi:hypothetical protein
MLPQHPHPAKIAGIANVGRRDNPGESHRFGLVKREPPMAVIKRRNGRSIEECQPMKFGERIRDVIFLTINPQIRYIGELLQIRRLLLFEPITPTSQ